MGFGVMDLTANTLLCTVLGTHWFSSGLVCSWEECVSTPINPLSDAGFAHIGAEVLDKGTSPWFVP